MVVMVWSFFREVLRLLPRHCAGPPILYCPFGGPEPGTIGLQSVAVKLLSFKIFFGDLLSTPPFPFCVADLKAIQRPETSTVPISGRKGSSSKVRPFIFGKGTQHSFRGVERNVTFW